MSVRLLLADDHPVVRDGVGAALAGSDFEVVGSASTGAEALSAIARLQPDIAVLDVSMPEGTGVEVLQALRARGDSRPVVILTANIEDSALLALMDNGVDGIVFKHAGMDSLLACLAAVRAGERFIPPELVERVHAVRKDQESNPLQHLTPREAELAWLVAQGMRNREIGDRLKMSEGAVKFALHAVFKKLGVTTRTQVAMMLQRRGLV